MGNGTHWQRGIVINTAHRDGAPWGMGHMGNAAMGQMVNICGYVLDHVQLP